MRGNRRVLGSSPPFYVRLGATAAATRCRRPSDSSPLSPTRVPQIHEKLRREHARRSSSPARQRIRKKLRFTSKIPNDKSLLLISVIITSVDFDYGICFNLSICEFQFSPDRFSFCP
ncbi:hypothetical protein LINGRAHAP2_LOCUS11263 [Linum grandiflorum]